MLLDSHISPIWCISTEVELCGCGNMHTPLCRLPQPCTRLCAGCHNHAQADVGLGPPCVEPDQETFAERRDAGGAGGAVPCCVAPVVLRGFVLTAEHVVVAAQEADLSHGPARRLGERCAQCRYVI